MDVQTRHNISRTDEERLLLLRANRKSYMPCRLAQQCDPDWLFHALRAIAAVAELVDHLI